MTGATVAPDHSFVPTLFPKEEHVRNLIRDSLLIQDVFSAIEPEGLELLVDAMFEVPTQLSKCLASYLIHDS